MKVSYWPVYSNLFFLFPFKRSRKTSKEGKKICFRFTFVLFLLYRYLTKYCKIKFWYVVITFPSKQNHRTNNEEKVDSFLYIVLMCNQIFTDNWVSWLRNSMLYNNHYNQLLAKSAKNFPSLLWFPFSVMIRKIKKLFYEITGRVGRFVTRMTMILGKAIIHLTIEIREDSV